MRSSNPVFARAEGFNGRGSTSGMTYPGQNAPRAPQYSAPSGMQPSYGGSSAPPGYEPSTGAVMTIDSVANSLKAHTSGGSVRANIAGALKEECSLSTSGGSVNVTVDKTAAFNLDASTSGGGVDAQGLTITLEKSNRD